MSKFLLLSRAYTPTSLEVGLEKIKQDNYLELDLFHEIRKGFPQAGNIYSHKNVAKAFGEAESQNTRITLLEVILSSQDIHPLNKEIKELLNQDALIAILEDQERRISTYFRSYIIYVKPKFERTARMALTGPEY